MRNRMILVKLFLVILGACKYYKNFGKEKRGRTYEELGMERYADARDYHQD